MNIMNLSNNGLTARFFAVLTIVSMILSAVPVAFFVAEAANTDAVGDITLAVIPSNTPDPETVTVTFTGTGTLDLTDWTLWDTLGSEVKRFTFGAVTLTTGQSYTVCHDGSCDGMSSGGATVWNDTGDTAQLRDENDITIVSTTWGAVTTGTEYSDSAAVDYAPGPVENTDTGETFDTVQEAIDDTDTDAGDTIVMSSDLLTLSQITINKEITLDGGGFMIDAAFTKTDNSNNSAIGIQSPNVTVRNLDLTSSGDAPWPEQLHGINVYNVDGVIIDDVSASDFEGTGIVVNSSKVTASDITTSNNGWHGINVDEQTSNEATLRISETSSHDEPLQIYIDDITKIALVDVDDVDTQYDITEFPNLVDVRDQVVDPRTARLYTLKTPEPEFQPLKLTSICTTGEESMRFRVQNTNPFPITATYEVVGTTDTGVVEVAAAGAGVLKYEGASDGADYTFFDTATVTANGTTKLLYTHDNQDYDTVKAANKNECPEVESTVHLHTQKIICEDEAELPNRSVPELITSTTAQEWVDKSQTCRLVDGWEFEWAPKGTADPGDTLVGTAGDKWTTFSGSTEIPVEDLKDKPFFWVREVLQAGYIPFTHGPEGNNNTDDFSAELHCHTDGRKFDNRDRIDSYEAGEDYYCVAWNVPAEVPMCTLEAVSDTGTVVVESNQFAVETFVHPNWTANIPGASWVWETFFVESPTQEETKTFKETFTVENPTNAYLDVAADNSYKIFVNGNLFHDESDNGNFTAAQQAQYDILSALQNGENTLEIEVINRSGNANPEKNPAGVLYKLVVDAETQCALTTDIMMGPYCGDGEVNQDWEMCEPGDEGCTDYCTFDNQCTDLQLAKITLDETESASFNGTLYLGAPSNAIPNGAWFNLNDAGDQSFVATANAVDGLAIERNQTDGTLAIAFVGGNGAREYDNVSGTIMSLGVDYGAVKRNIPSFSLEDGSGNSHEDIFEKNGDTITFDMRANKRNDGATVEINPGEEYDCPECKATVEARVILNDYGTAGEGDLSDEIILGDAGYTTVGFGEWFPISEAANPGESAVMIMDPNTVTNFDNPDDKPGLFVSREDGTVKVALYGKHPKEDKVTHEWIDARIEVRDAQITNYSEMTTAFKFEDHPENRVPSNNGFDDASVDATGVDFKLWVNTASDGFRFDIDTDSIVACVDDTIDEETPETERIYGYKYETGVEVNPGLAGWTIELRDVTSAVVQSTTTDENGYYYFDVPIDAYYTVHEVMQTDWVQDSVDVGFGGKTFDLDVNHCSFEVYPYEYNFFSAALTDSVASVQLIEDYSCDFYNTYNQPEEPDESEDDDSNGRSSSGTRTQRAATPAPLVLGESVSQCPFLVDFMQMGVENDALEVMKLQLFLNIFKDLFGGTANPVTGTFGATTDANVKAFQEAYRSEILDPWYNLGIVPHNRPTGFVYKTTLWKINDIVCPEWGVLPELEGETLEENVDIDAAPIAD